MKKLNLITIENDIATIHIHSPKYGKFEAIIDAYNVDLVKDYTWCINKHGNLFYVVSFIKIANGKYKPIKLHRLIMNFPELFIDHENHLGWDNRVSNLRLCTRQQNNMNRRSFKLSSSLYKGVRRTNNSKKWRATIRVNGKDIHLGMFTSEIDAAIAYNNAALKYQGEFARLNIIPNH